MSHVRYRLGFVRSISDNVDQLLVQHASTIVSAATTTRSLMKQGWRIMHISKSNCTPLDEIEFGAFAVLVSRNNHHGTQS